MDAVPPTLVPKSATSTFTMLGDITAESCVGEVCVIPEHHIQAVVNRQLDSDAV